jgi:hypothetical protein
MTGSREAFRGIRSPNGRVGYERRHCCRHGPAHRDEVGRGQPAQASRRLPLGFAKRFRPLRGVKRGQRQVMEQLEPSAGVTMSATRRLAACVGALRRQPEGEGTRRGNGVAAGRSGESRGASCGGRPVGRRRSQPRHRRGNGVAAGRSGESRGASRGGRPVGRRRSQPRHPAGTSPVTTDRALSSPR